MEKAYRGMMGYAVLKEGEARQDFTHVVLSVEEYSMLQKQVRDARAEAERARRQQYQAEDRMRDGITEAEKKAEVAIAEGRKAMAADLKREHDGRLLAESQRIQLVEIMKNRANARRGIQPKKKHHGYVVLKSEQYEYGFQPDKATREMLTLWRTTVQTPVDIRMKAQEAAGLIHTALMTVFGKSLGFTGMSLTGKGLSENIKAIKKEEWGKGLYLLDIKYRQNTRTQLWEVIYVHNRPVTVPEEMYA